MVIESRHVLAVRNLSLSADYFRRCLGFAGTSPCAGWEMLSLGTFTVLLGECPDAMPAARAGDHAYFANIIVDDVDRYYESFEKNGALLESPPGNRPWGLREIVVRTPDGHRMVFASECPTPES